METHFSVHHRALARPAGHESGERVPFNGIRQPTFLLAYVSLDEIAKSVGVSRYYLARAFGVAIGCSVMRYVRGGRLTEAARSLINGAPDILTAIARGRKRDYPVFEGCLIETVKQPWMQSFGGYAGRPAQRPPEHDLPGGDSAHQFADSHGVQAIRQSHLD
jgi:AraC-like DNA-binding protein